MPKIKDVNHLSEALNMKHRQQIFAMISSNTKKEGCHE